jgi:hypothetical protein
MATLAIGLLTEAPAMISGVAAMVHGVESLFGKGNGAAKKAAVQAAVGGAVQAYNSGDTATGTKLPQINAPDFQAALGALIDAIVGVYNSLGVFKSASTTPAPATT